MSQHTPKLCGDKTTYSPHIFAGLNCPCGERHYQGAAYYVSVAKDSQVMLAAGPFAEHSDALAKVDAVREIVMGKWNPGGEAHWYGYGTTAMPCGYDRPGKLNGEVL